MCLVSKRTNNAYTIGICPEYLSFCASKRRKYEDDPTAMDVDLKKFQDRGIVEKVKEDNNLTLILILKEGNGIIKKVKIECVDKIQTIFFLLHMEDIMEKNCFHPCNLPCCILKELRSAL